MDASANTQVLVTANAWDMDSSLASDGCPPLGCVAENTRDKSLDPVSRWSCKYSLENEPCELCFELIDEPQDVVRLDIAFYKGNIRQRTFEVTTEDDKGATDTVLFTSSGDTLEFGSCDLYSDETVKICMTPAGDDLKEWLSITEVTYFWG